MGSMSAEYVVLDLRDERGRFFCRPKLPMETYRVLEAYAKLRGITFDELLHQAIEEYVSRNLTARTGAPPQHGWTEEDRLALEAAAREGVGE
jgi:hypothetical protein